MQKTVQLLRDHMHETHLDRPEQFDRPLSATDVTNDYPVRESATSFKNMSTKHEASVRV
jgi:hypothetical protein